MLYYENKLQNQGFDFIIGTDEAGRGPLAGPVVAAAVSLTNTDLNVRIDDSKKLTEKQRETAYSEIIKNSFYGISVISEKIIDSMNILQASRLAMKEAVTALLQKIGINNGKNIHLLIDGNIKLDLDLPSTSIIKGDGKSMSIASASILAKVTRDRIMLDLDKEYPQYGFSRHKGYPTVSHREAIKKFGLSKIHRKTFSCV